MARTSGAIQFPFRRTIEVNRSAFSPVGRGRPDPERAGIEDAHRAREGKDAPDDRPASGRRMLEMLDGGVWAREEYGLVARVLPLDEVRRRSIKTLDLEYLPSRSGSPERCP